MISYNHLPPPRTPLSRGVKYGYETSQQSLPTPHHRSPHWAELYVPGATKPPRQRQARKVWWEAVSSDRSQRRAHAHAQPVTRRLAKNAWFRQMSPVCRARGPQCLSSLTLFGDNGASLVMLASSRWISCSDNRSSGGFRGEATVTRPREMPLQRAKAPSGRRRREDLHVVIPNHCRKSRVAEQGRLA